ncbi:hypothetical protein [Peribacillus sp. NPDC097295]|uniref:hypothetical protein n=1 Tax=Peribacillus sp. NPDC097295 TaxID=3364402 RepID=UPI0037F6A28A
MRKVKTVKIDGENVFMFNSAIYIFEAGSRYTLELDMIVSEIVLKKYGHLENLIIEIEMEDGEVISTIMHLRGLVGGGLPQLNLYSEMYDLEDYGGFQIVNENDVSFPNIEEGISLEEIRKVEMPNEKINLKLHLPINQTEWLAKQGKNLNGIMKEAIYDYWKKNLK